ncbi:MAG: hypothetical protein J5758_04900, partial [Abditibacteriota bacterium]|nr:hypothetical protein [Abditibacteriota bacterium]
MKSFVYIIAAVSLAVIGTLAYCGAAGNTAAPVSSPAMAETAPAAQKPQTLTITEAPKERRIKVSGLTIIKKAFGDTETVN